MFGFTSLKHLNVVYKVLGVFVLFTFFEMFLKRLWAVEMIFPQYD